MIVIEKKLNKLFDFQKFEKNKDLQRIINDVEERYSESEVIGDYQLSFVAGGKKLDERIKIDKDKDQ